MLRVTRITGGTLRPSVKIPSTKTMQSLPQDVPKANQRQSEAPLESNTGHTWVKWKWKEKRSYIFGHFQNSEDKENVLLAILELLVFKAPVGLAISQLEVVGQGFEVGGDVGFGFRLPLEPKGSASLVYLLQQLQWDVSGRQLITKGPNSRHAETQLGKPNPSIWISPWLPSNIADCERQNTQKR